MIPLFDSPPEKKAVKLALVRLLPTATQGVLLDLACGTGTLTRDIKSTASDYAVRGIDGDSDLLARAQERKP